MSVARQSSCMVKAAPTPDATPTILPNEKDTLACLIEAEKDTLSPDPTHPFTNGTKR